MGNRRIHISADLFDIGAKIHAFGVVVAVQPLVGAGNCIYPPRGFLQLAGRFLDGRARLHLQQTYDNRETVFYPMVHLLHEELLPGKSNLQVALIAFPFDGHAEDICGTLEKSQIVLYKFVF